VRRGRKGQANRVIPAGAEIHLRRSDPERPSGDGPPAFAGV